MRHVLGAMNRALSAVAVTIALLAAPAAFAQGPQPSAAAIATPSAVGSAMPMSSDASTMMRRAMNRGSSPASIMRAR